MVVLRHSFANPIWWSYHLFARVQYHTAKGVRY
jgi:hypothetical protein